MKTITVAELRQNPTAALTDVEIGETYVVTKHRRAIAKLVPVEEELQRLTSVRHPQPSNLSGRSREPLHGYAETEALLAEIASDW